jgi:hypothetical protein
MSAIDFTVWDCIDLRSPTLRCYTVLFAGVSAHKPMVLLNWSMRTNLRTGEDLAALQPTLECFKATLLIGTTKGGEWSLSDLLGGHSLVSHVSARQSYNVIVSCSESDLAPAQEVARDKVKFLVGPLYVWIDLHGVHSSP